jgi:hypothetical protein
VNINNLYQDIQNYYTTHYTIFDEISKNELKHMIENNAFYHFIFYDDQDNQHITDYICFFRLNSIGMHTKEAYGNGYTYLYFSNISDKISKIKMAYILDYLKSNNIFDMITCNQIKLIDSFNYIEGTAKLKYYMYNTHVPTISDTKNGLVTI